MPEGMPLDDWALRILIAGATQTRDDVSWRSSQPKRTGGLAAATVVWSGDCRDRSRAQHERGYREHPDSGDDEETLGLSLVPVCSSIDSLSHIRHFRLLLWTGCSPPEQNLPATGRGRHGERGSRGRAIFRPKAAPPCPSRERHHHQPARPAHLSRLLVATS